MLKTTFAFRLLCVSLLLVLGLGTMAYGQGTANLVGTVTDPSGAVVPNAKITATNLDNGFVYTDSSNGAGNYKLSALPNGKYTLKVEAASFKTYEQKNISVDIGMTVRLDVPLQIGNVGVTVTVEAAALQVQAATNDVSQTVTDNQISNLATNGRNILQLVPLVPGAASQMPDFDRPGAQFQNRSVEFNGMRSDDNNWTIDGGEAYDRGGGGILLVSPSQDAISEFTVTTSNYAADLGNSSGGMTSMGLKSGSKKFHASAYLYDRNDALNAYQYNQKDTAGTVGKKDELRYNAFGFNGSGPVEFKSSNPKTFFFYNQEWRREVNPGANYSPQVFTASELTGQLDTLNALIGTGGRAAGTPLMWVPNTTDAAAVTKFANAGLKIQQAIPNNDLSVYKASLLNSNALAYINSGVLLTPNKSDGRTYFASPKETEYWREELGRVDHQFNEKISIFAHAIYDSDSQQQPNVAWNFGTFPTIKSLEGVPSWQGVVHLTMNLRPNLLNEIAYNENGNNIVLGNSGLWQETAGFAPTPLFAGANTIHKWPSINIGSGGATIGENMPTGNWPWKNWWRSNQIKDDLSYIKGNHNFKAGFAWYWSSKVQQIFVDTAGNYTFGGGATGCDPKFNYATQTEGTTVGNNPGCTSSAITGLGIADFMLGYVGNFNQPALQDAVAIHFQSPDAYLMDDWRITRRLTLNLGVRWEGMAHAYDAHGRLSNFYPYLFSPANAPRWATSNFNAVTGVPNTNVLCDQNNGSAVCAGANTAGFQLGSAIKGSQASLAGFSFYMNGIGLSGQNGIPKGLTRNHYMNFAPRIGFAYDVFGDQKTILRGGGGIFFERNAGNEEYNQGSNIPFIATTSVNNVYLNTPTTSFVDGSVAGKAPVTSSGFWSIDPNLRPSMVYQYNLQIQEQLKSNMVATLGYVGNNSSHLSDTYDANNTLLGQTTYRTQVCGTNCGGLPFQQGDPYRPYQGWGSLGVVEDEAGGHYHSLQGTVRATAFHNLTFGLAYTFAHGWDQQDAQIVFGQNGNESNSFNPKYDYGTSGFDRRQVAALSFDYNVPIFQHDTGLAGKVMGGWTISGISSMQTGTPIGIGASNWSGLQSAGNRANQVSRAEITNTVSNVGGVSHHTWFNPGAFAQPGFDANGLGLWGNGGKNPVKGPGRQNWNLSLYKDFKFTERAGFQFKAESFNTWNHTQFTGVQGGLISGTKGGPNNPQAAWLNNTTTDPREFQIGGKLYF